MAEPILPPTQPFLPKSPVQYYRWIKIAIIMAVLIASLGFALLANPTLNLLGLAAIIGGAGVLFFLRHPQFGLIALIITSFFLPSPLASRGPAVLTSTVLLLLLLLGLWFFDMLTRQKRISVTYSRTVPPLLIFVAVTLIALINGQINYYPSAQIAPSSAQISGVAVFVLSAGAYLLVANQVRQLIWLKRGVWVFLVAGGIYVFSRTTYQIEDIIRPFYQYGSDASIFWLWLVTLAFSQAVFNHKLSQRARLALAAVFVWAIYISIVQSYEWKSGWLPALVSLGAMVIVGFPRQRVPLILLSIVVGSIIYYFDQTTLISGGEDYSIVTRVEAWRIVIEIVKVNPVLGVGPSNYYWYTPLFPILGYSVSFNSHNNYIDIFAQTGIIGLACFLWFIWEVGRSSWRLMGRARPGFERAYLIGILGGLAGTMMAAFLGDWVIPFVYNVGLFGFRSSIFGWMFLGGLVVIEQVIAQRAAAGSVEADR